MAAPATAAVPDTTSLRALAAAAHDCTACPLYRDTTQTVFGKGPERAMLILVGEQPGDVEDKKGKPFVGPAGRVLWECVEAAGIAHDAVYATNAVKHFKHVQRGKRRLHQRPNAAEIDACAPWLQAELRAIPNVPVVAMGAVAARSLFGRPVSVGEMRGAVHEVRGRRTLVTYHPSAVLRAEDEAAAIRRALVDDLRRAAALA